MKATLVIAAMLGGCMTNPPALDACATQSDYAACRTSEHKDGWCVPDAGCMETCDEISDTCWNYTYAWPHDPAMSQPPICWCTDDSPWPTPTSPAVTSPDPP